MAKPGNSGEANEVSFAKGKTIYKNGAVGEDAFLLKSGTVELTIPGREKGKRAVAEVIDAPGRVFGLLSLVDGLPRMMTAKAATNVTCDVVSKSLFIEKLKASAPQIGCIVSDLTTRYREMAQRLSLVDTLSENHDQGKPAIEDTQRAPIPEMGKQHFHAGDIIYREGRDSDRAYMLDDGRVELYKAQGPNRITVELIARAGTYFGLLPLVDEGPHVATARVLKETECTVVDRATYAKWIEESDPMVASFVGLLGAHLREMSEQLQQR